VTAREIIRPISGYKQGQRQQSAIVIAESKQQVERHRKSYNSYYGGVSVRADTLYRAPPHPPPPAAFEGVLDTLPRDSSTAATPPVGSARFSMKKRKRRKKKR
jgi:hypothetical protein